MFESADDDRVDVLEGRGDPDVLEGRGDPDVLEEPGDADVLPHLPVSDPGNAADLGDAGPGAGGRIVSPGAESPLHAAPSFQLNRVIVLLGPYIALISGGIASWLSQHFPGLVSDVSDTTQGITQAVTFVVGAGITFALQHKYLDGWQRWEGGLLAIEVARQGGSTAPAPSSWQATAPGADDRRWAPQPVSGEPFPSFDRALFDTDPRRRGRG